MELRRITLQEIYSKLVLLDPLLEELTARNEQGDQEARTGLHSAFDARHTLENLEASLNQSGTVEFY